ncbi:cobalamin biosynthesis protein CobD [Vandammella animalimorsus]|uniref:Cobalamin biosynthesis protein CobD n=1 Tax=Vandammella animalimorsus TaxID=2029117 RepID=A0A3M6RSX1_9BURK|nr:adenosylcobinamide-phosphate synthase CbiB [Vandammella animalimorsus]RMX17994.1 cobalamin biosynthesis protein CobD [Vandammella animalimorsus]
MDAWHWPPGAWPLVLTLGMSVALLVDRWLGEPAVRWHPVVWMGRSLQRLQPWLFGGRAQGAAQARQRLWRGALAWLALALLWTALAWALQAALLQAAWQAQGRMPPLLTSLALALLLGALLKPLLAWRMLRQEVQAVEQALAQSLPAGRAQLARLVSRETARLDAAQVRESAIETLAENLSDSVVAPLFWFALLGLPGAALYRFANTADAMWGYPGQRGGRDWQWAGKWAARADDALSWLPARLTALLLLLANPAQGGWRRRTWQQLGAQACKTPSPNGGWPMAATALLLGCRLGKPGAYVLHPQAPAPQPAQAALAQALAGRALGLWLLAAWLLAALYGLWALAASASVKGAL